MRYIELLEDTGPITGLMYHVTTDNRLRKIKAEGLEPGHHRRWKNSWGARLGDRGFIYLMSDLTSAVQFAAKQDYEHRATGKKVKSVILVLQNVPSEGLVHDDHIEGQLAGNTWYKSPATIPPEDIVRVIELTPEMIKQLVSGKVEQPQDQEQQDQQSQEQDGRLFPTWSSPNAKTA